MPKILDKIIKVKARIMEVNLLEKNLNLLMDHYQKAKDQDHQRANFPDKMEKVKVKIKMENQNLTGKMAKMENQIQNLMEKMENQIVKIKMENQIQNLMEKMENQSQNQIAKTENHQNQIIKMAKIQNSIITMAMNPQQDILQLKTV
jgi:hypothetical protein